MEFLHLPPPPRRLLHPPSHSLVDRSSPDELGQCTRFPISSDRLGWVASFPPPFVLHSPGRYDPLGSLAEDQRVVARRALCSSFAPRFSPSHIARGVLSDGTWTTEHPSVHAFLQSPSSRPLLVSRTSAAIYSLAALYVFYSPSHPSYDVFWRPDIKESTAAMEPSPISTAPMTWLGVHDMLWQLTGIQKEYYKSQGGKPSAPPLVPTRRSLRKRKPVQTLIEELSRELSEVPEPPRKKSKTTTSDENDKGLEVTPSDGGTLAATAYEVHGVIPTRSAREADPTPSPLTITSSLPPESHPAVKDDVAQVGTSRRRAKDEGGKKAQDNTPPSRSSARRTRERSPSFSSGSSTAVSAAGGNSKRARSSSSASSTITTVDHETGPSKGKGKGKEKADVIAKEETDEEEEEDAEKAGKRSTRSRRSTAKEAVTKPSRKPSSTTSSRSPAETAKLATSEAPRRARNRSGVTSSRSRRSRKS
ncbi:hypothetical protein BC826DRAFT_965950 [Russula brevipes]|nr:hypothetical protein BC826DRAFT_965950 [Russula brevipes]